MASWLLSEMSLRLPSCCPCWRGAALSLGCQEGLTSHQDSQEGEEPVATWVRLTQVPKREGLGLLESAIPCPGTLQGSQGHGAGLWKALVGVDLIYSLG